MEIRFRKAPLWGGCFERMVASVKDCLRKTLGHARLTYQELFTVLVEVESTMNSRPLIYEYEEVNNEIVTPSHLIYGRRSKSLPDQVVEPADALSMDSDVSDRFKYISTRLSHF